MSDRYRDMKQRAETNLWALFRDTKACFDEDPRREYHEQQIGIAIRLAFNFGRELERQIDEQKMMEWLREQRTPLPETDFGHLSRDAASQRSLKE